MVELSSGLPRDAATVRQFFDPSLREAWRASTKPPYDFLVQSPTWKLGAISISILRQQFDQTYVAVAFDNQGRAVTLNFILVNGPEGWVISDVESPHDSLRMFLAQVINLIGIISISSRSFARSDTLQEVFTLEKQRF